MVRQYYQNFKDAILGRNLVLERITEKYAEFSTILIRTLDSDGKPKVYNLNNIASSVASGRRVAVPTPFSYELEANFPQEGQK